MVPLLQTAAHETPITTMQLEVEYTMDSIPLTRPTLGLPEYHAVRRVLKSGWLTQGPEVEALEHEFAQFVGAPGACAVSSATTALHLALRALEIGPGQEVIVPSHTFIATVHAILYCGATPRFIDIDEDTYCLDPALLESLITPRTACILLVHQMGFTPNLEKVLATAEKYKLPVVEDAACALGTEYFWRGTWTKIGKPHGLIACFSFHPRKVITSGEGGMVTSHDVQLLERIRRLRQHGITQVVSSHNRFSNHYTPMVEELGYNYRLSDVAAAILRCQLQRLPALVRKRRLLASIYDHAFTTLPGCRILEPHPNCRPNYQSYPLRIAPDARVSRDELLSTLAKHGIEARPGVMNVHEVARYITGATADLTRSERANRNTILLPLYPAMRPSQQARVIRVIQSSLCGAELPCTN